MIDGEIKMATLLEEDRFVSADYKALTVAELVELAQDQDDRQ